MVAILLAFIAAAQVTAARSEESEGRLDPLLTRPVTRTRWLAGRLLVAVLALAACATLAGLATLAGAVAGGAHVDAGAVVGAGLNTLAPAVCVLGLGVLAFGIAPRLAAPAVYGVVAWSVLVDVIGGIGALDHWVADTSVFHQMAAVPSVPPNWPAIGWMVALGIVSARRRLRGLRPTGRRGRLTTRPRRAPSARATASGLTRPPVVSAHGRPRRRRHDPHAGACPGSSTSRASGATCTPRSPP